jgi:hypothetical protein
MHTKGPRCTKCVWIHEADSTAGTSFQGVGLCPLHAAAPELLALVRAYATTYPLDVYQDKALALIAKAEGR